MPSTSSEINFTELMPISSPLLFRRAPPLLPGLMAASVWISLLVIFCPSDCTVTSRFNALTIPDVTDNPYPYALPIATTGSPTFNAEESPTVAILMLSMVSSGISDSLTAITARSLFGSVPLILAEITLLSSAASPSELK